MQFKVVTAYSNSRS